MTLDWLEELEDRVREASERLGELRGENRTLTEKVAELEARLAARPEGAAVAMPVTSDTAVSQAKALAAEAAKAAAAAKALEAANAAASAASTAHAAERAEIRARVEKMAKGLEALVEVE